MPKHDLPYALANVSFPAKLSAENSESGITRGYGTTVGNGIEGWAPGATFIHVDGATSGTLVYVNIGTSTTASWVPVSDPRLHYEQLCTTMLFYDDFAPQIYTYTETDDGATGTATVGTHATGAIEVATAAADNDYHYLNAPGPVVDVDAAGSSFKYEGKVYLAEAATNAANWWCGLIIPSDISASVLAANGAGTPADYDGMIFYKVDGTMTIQFEASRATTQETQSMGTFTSATWYKLGIVLDDNNGSPQVTPYLNGTAGTTVSWPYVSPEAYYSGFGVRAGSGSAETLLVDYHKAVWWKTGGRT